MSSTTFVLPDLYSVFSQWEVPQRMNKHYETVSKETEGWLSPFCQWERNKLVKLAAADFTYLPSVVFPDNDYETFRTVSDYFTWAFVYDDRFDVGEFATDSDAAEIALSQTFRMLIGDPSAEALGAACEYSHGVDMALKDIWRRAYPQSSPGARRRFVETLGKWFESVLGQINGAAPGDFLSVEDVVQLRVWSVADKPCYALTEYALGINLTDEIMQIPAMARIYDLTSELMFLVNDIVSYAVEKDDGPTHNIISAIMLLRGVGVQAAMSEAEAMMVTRVAEWEAAKKDLAYLTGREGNDVREYISAMERWLVGCVSWSYRSKRYFGYEGAQVKDTLVVDLTTVLPSVTSAVA
ncbi:hypothetical protein BOTBODRAFT_35044 [Botryobasidium botryosum FD-172 SS1]|uniref:Terpene synthase n=1 Tax=Botryobasidium botryosum (strain FD-172 SS1) TaxID=930990 RepID=A0A067M8B0_BOTB1|nr:hypothetical protein BOTBODRAFT_35044 [Botryobasidium botryosum FD-172 SS1]